MSNNYTKNDYLIDKIQKNEQKCVIRSLRLNS